MNDGMQKISKRHRTTNVGVSEELDRTGDAMRPAKSERQNQNDNCYRSISSRQDERHDCQISPRHSQDQAYELIAVALDVPSMVVLLARLANDGVVRSNIRR